jgi:hypothetical protein
MLAQLGLAFASALPVAWDRRRPQRKITPGMPDARTVRLLVRPHGSARIEREVVVPPSGARVSTLSLARSCDCHPQYRSHSTSGDPVLRRGVCNCGASGLLVSEFKHKEVLWLSKVLDPNTRSSVVTRDARVSLSRARATAASIAHGNRQRRVRPTCREGHIRISAVSAGTQAVGMRVHALETGALQHGAALELRSDALPRRVTGWCLRH